MIRLAVVAAGLVALIRGWGWTAGVAALAGLLLARTVALGRVRDGAVGPGAGPGDDGGAAGGAGTSNTNGRGRQWS